MYVVIVHSLASLSFLGIARMSTLIVYCRVVNNTVYLNMPI